MAFARRFLSPLPNRCSGIAPPLRRRVSYTGSHMDGACGGCMTGDLLMLPPTKSSIRRRLGDYRGSSATARSSPCVSGFPSQVQIYLQGSHHPPQSLYPPPPISWARPPSCPGLAGAVQGWLRTRYCTGVGLGRGGTSR